MNELLSIQYQQITQDRWRKQNNCLVVPITYLIVLQQCAQIFLMTMVTLMKYSLNTRPYFELQHNKSPNVSTYINFIVYNRTKSAYFRRKTVRQFGEKLSLQLKRQQHISTKDSQTLFDLFASAVSQCMQCISFHFESLI